MAAKEVRFADDARHQMVDGVNVLANAVKVTLKNHKSELRRIDFT